MSRKPSQILAYHINTRHAYVFRGQTAAARWLVASGLCRGQVQTARANLIAASDWPHRKGTSTSTRQFHGFVWVRGGDDAPVSLLMDKLVRRLRIWALTDANWGNCTDAELQRGMSAARVVDPAHGPSKEAPLASGIRIMDEIPPAQI